ncbi:MAG: hypothetical protein J4F41_07700 [Alphaproteobacteria bacterium]|nr:hypothetical protein [Alphaproteobacteria bacterium]
MMIFSPLTLITQASRRMALSVAAAAMMMSVPAPALAQSSVELFQNRVNALEEGLKDVRGILEEDFRALKQSLADQGSAAPESITNLENKIAKLVDQMSAMNNRIERTLEVASDNEFRLLRMEKRLESLMRMGIDGNLAVVEPGGPETNTGAGEVPSASLNANSSEDGNWTISANKLDEEIANLPNPEDAAPTNPSPTNAAQVDEVAAAGEDEPKQPSVLPEVSPYEQYRFALGLALQNNLDKAEEAFAEFIAINPDDEQINDATFWLGRVQFSKGAYEQAAMTFTEFNTQWPTDSRREKTTLWIAESISYFAAKDEVCDLLVTLPNVIEDPPPNFFERLDELKQKSECSS